MKRNLLLTPGPTQVPPQLCEVLGRPIIHHRTPQFQNFLKEAFDGLKYVLQTQHDVYLLAASGTGAMEASVCSFLSPGDKAITVEGGKFGERWTELCRAYQVEPKVVEVPWGRAVSPKVIEKMLSEDKDIKAVYVTHCETSTGVTTDLKALGEVVKKTNAILVVDSVSALGVIELKMDDWNVDVVASASHKGFMLPPGVAIVAASPKAQALMAQSKCPKYYFDLRKYKKVVEKTDTPFTPAIGIVIALTESLRLVKETGLDNLFKHYERLAKATREAAKALGLSLLAEESCISNVLTAINLPEGMDGGKVVKRMRDTYGISVAGGQGDLKGKIIRIAHMGCLDEYDMLTGISCLEKVLKELGYKFKLGAGVAAAQTYFNENQ
ncbi:MAG TPA: alanine--glyoxylate aminotransferase family protein [Candidatus Omnitrophota bacterium]|nr:alanine--glyoxylate aminotransferase family protein [Candidatus Omnitrophota bacterium]